MPVYVPAVPMVAEAAVLRIAGRLALAAVPVDAKVVQPVRDLVALRVLAGVLDAALIVLGVAAVVLQPAVVRRLPLVPDAPVIVPARVQHARQIAPDVLGVLDVPVVVDVTAGVPVVEVALAVVLDVLEAVEMLAPVAMAALDVQGLVQECAKDAIPVVTQPALAVVPVVQELV